MTTATASPAAVSTQAPKQRRGTELALLVFAYAIALGAFAQVDLVLLDQLSTDFTTFAIAFGSGLLVAHFSLRWLAPYADPILLPTVSLLNGLGLAMIHRLDLAEDLTPTDPDYVAQLGWFVLGIGLFVAVLFLVRDHRVLQRYTYTAMLVGLLLLVLPLLPFIGTEINGARIWIQLESGFTHRSASSRQRSPRSC